MSETMQSADGVEQGDYICGETGVHEIVQISNEVATLKLVSEASRSRFGADEEKQAPLEAIDSYGSLIKKDEWDAVGVADGQYIWEQADERVSVNVNDSDVEIESDCAVIPDKMNVGNFRAAVALGTVSEQ